MTPPPSEVHPKRCLKLEFLPSPVLSLFLRWCATCSPSSNEKIDRMSYLQMAEVLFPRQRLRTTTECVQEGPLQTIFRYTSLEGNYRGVRITLQKERCEEVRGEAWQLFTCLFATDTDITHSHFILIYILTAHWAWSFIQSVVSAHLSTLQCDNWCEMRGLLSSLPAWTW